ncbi:ABC transporter substrate-binding protein [Amaricoccus sp. W119]|uniref:ABC transporter substrate-binding protein n=1 Tax=Amaricoccus sp. W119 TaxID=3391833 RepID=UPI0039A62920
MKKLIALILAGTALTAPPAVAGEVEYWMWDGRQVPVYQQCADLFEARNPEIRIDISQFDWGSYWTTLLTGFISGDAPDVFVDHLSRFPDFIENDILVDLAPLIERDGYDMAGFMPGLAENWSRDGARYGMPKDWDTVAIVYNKEMVAEAGLTEADMRELTWNPRDGGSYEKVIARLTLDKNGVRGDEEGFNPDRIASFGLLYEPVANSPFGQSEWSYLSASTGFSFIDGPWARDYHVDDPRLAETLNWLQDLAYGPGYAPKRTMTGKLGASTLFVSRMGAMNVHGSWMINWYRDNAPFEVGFAPVPAGPEGRRSMFNGLADSIWSGSDNQAEAWEWVKFLGSEECQTIVGKSAIVFPARSNAVPEAIATHEANGVDVSAFTDLATPETTFAFPITENPAQITKIMSNTLELIMLNEGEPADLLKDASDEIDALF